MGFEKSTSKFYSFQQRNQRSKKSKWFTIIVQVIDGGEADLGGSKIHFLLPAVLSYISTTKQNFRLEKQSANWMGLPGDSEH